MAIIIFAMVTGAAVLISGIVWIVSQRGTTTRRSGSDIGAELMDENMVRQARRSGKPALFRKTFFWGKGWAVERSASVSYKEVKERARDGDLNLLLPLIMMFIGIFVISIALDLLLFRVFDTIIPGILYLVFFLYGCYVVITGFISA